MAVRDRRSVAAPSAVLAAALTALLLAAAPALAAGGGLSWTSATPIDHNGGQPLTSVACTSGSQCVAVDVASQAVTFNPAAPSSKTVEAVGGGNSLSNVACPSSAECVALDGAADQEITFTPGGTASTPEEIDATTGTVSSLSCPLATECVAVDTAGNEVEFNPTSVTTPPTAHPIGMGATAGESPSVSCASPTQCTAVDYTGSAVTFDPTAGTVTDALTTIDSGFNTNPDDDALFGVDCTSTSQCVAVDGGGNEVTFDPSSPATSATHSGVNAGNGSNGVACASGTQCTVVGQNGTEATFDPTTGAIIIAAAIDTGQTPSSVACPSTSQCVAVDGAGNAIIFDPGSPGGATPTRIDPGSSLYDVSCPAIDECVAVDGDGAEITFDPSNPSATAATYTIDGGGTLYGVSCPDSSQCTAVDRGGNEVTFDPADGSVLFPGVATVDTVPTFDHVSCPSADLCSAVDESGQEVSWDPSDPAARTIDTIDSGHPLYSVSCPTTSECSAVDGDGQEVSYVPGTNESPIGSIQDIDGTQDFYSVFCTSTTSCTAGDNVGQIVTYDPTAASNVVTTPLTYVDPGNFLLGISCVSSGSPIECVAVDQHGDVVAGVPTDPAGWSVTAISGERTMDGVSCLSTTPLCAAVDIAGNVTLATGSNLVPVATAAPTIPGTAVAGQTLSLAHGAWSNDPTGYADQWEDCDASGGGCTAIAGATGTTYTLAAADVGHTIVVSEVASNGYGAGSAAASAPTTVVAAAVTAATGGVPVETGPPTISGDDVAGQTLSLAHGSWSNGPTAFAYQWERCNSSASGCQPIAGATGQTYTLTSSEVGATIRVVETASNGDGSGAPATSIATLVIKAPTTTPSRGSAPKASVHTVKVSSRTRTASFRLAATGRSTGFRCGLVLLPTRKGAKAPKVRYVACGRLRTYRHLRPGRYVLHVRAVGPGGTQKVPTTVRFRIK